MRSDRGFTLVELLAALVAGSLLLASLSWNVASLGRELHKSRGDPVLAAVEATAPGLRSLLEQAIASPPKDNRFSGDDHHLNLLVAPPMALGSAGPVKLDLDARPTASGMGLFMTLSATEASISLPSAATTEHKLLDGLASIRFDYRLRPLSDSIALPRLISIHFVGRHAGEADIAVAPRLNSDGGCRFDPISLSCRA